MILKKFSRAEKGFCIKGDSCPYDHGTDAVVVDDFSSVPQTNAEDKTTVPISKPQPVPLQPPPMLPSHPVMRGLPMGIPFPPPPVCFVFFLIHFEKC